MRDGIKVDLEQIVFDYHPSSFNEIDNGHTIQELAFAWILGHPVVSSVIAGATKIDQIVANAKAGDWKLTPDQVAEVTKLVGKD